MFLFVFVFVYTAVYIFFCAYTIKYKTIGHKEAPKKFALRPTRIYLNTPCITHFRVVNQYVLWQMLSFIGWGWQ